MPTFKSGAFAQQCFSAHPLSLNFKALLPPDRLSVACANCHMRHRFTFRSLTTREGEAGAEARDAAGELAKCAAAHPPELRVSLVDVVRDVAKLRCGACHRTYTLDVSAFETYQKEG
jgi:hypothetical protein